MEINERGTILFLIHFRYSFLTIVDFRLLYDFWNLKKKEFSYILVPWKISIFIFDSMLIVNLTRMSFWCVFIIHYWWLDCGHWWISPMNGATRLSLSCLSIYSHFFFLTLVDFQLFHYKRDYDFENFLKNWNRFLYEFDELFGFSFV